MTRTASIVEIEKAKQSELHSIAGPLKKVKIKTCMTDQSKSDIDSGDEARFHFQLYPLVAFSTVLSVKPHRIF